ncbi:hypothetical protein JCM11491_003239 [Sporobolomyces phaffii]
MHPIRNLVASLFCAVLATAAFAPSTGSGPHPLGGVSAASTAPADQLHLTHGIDAAGQPQVTFGIDPTEGFTLFIATYQRDLLLPPLLKHLTSTPPPSLRQILVIWQNVDRPVPDFLSPGALDEYSTSGVAVSVRKSWKNSMNERFRPVLDWGEPIATDAVMILDDDVVLRKDALEWGYQQFVAANGRGSGGGPGRIVGFTARDFELRDGIDAEWAYVTKPRTSYSMVLSNAAFFKKEWLVRYWQDSTEMRRLRDYVDSVFNCDDLLINYVVSNLTHSPPLLLQPATPLRTVPTEGGLWNRVVVVDPNVDPNEAGPSGPDTIETAPPRPEHFSTRKECLAHFFDHFSQFAPESTTATSAARSQSSHYPLVKTRTSVSQDVEDHSRWMFDNELWETVTWSKPIAPAADAGAGASDDEDEDDEAAMLERGDYESFLHGLTDDEVDELLKSLDDAVGASDDDDAEQTPAEVEGGPAGGSEATARPPHEEL